MLVYSETEFIWYVSHCLAYCTCPGWLDDDECGAVGGMIVRGNRSTWGKPAAVPLCLPQIPHNQTWATEVVVYCTGRVNCTLNYLIYNPIFKTLSIWSCFMLRVTYKFEKLLSLCLTTSFLSDSFQIICCSGKLDLQVSRYVKRSRMKQVMADLALTQVANRAVSDLTQSEYRRLMIGVQLVRDPGNKQS
jgi:hypothetical protein